jgi:tetratricopeptide (TPR) repeat protein
MATLKKEAYLTQIFAYFKNEEYEKAYEFGKEFVEAYPKEMISHFLLAKVAFRLKKYEKAAEEARAAFNLAVEPDEMVLCAVLASTAYYQTGEFEKGYELLEKMKKIKNSGEIERMLFILSIAKNDSEKAMEHLEHLAAFNKKAAEDLILKYLSRTEKS